MLLFRRVASQMDFSANPEGDASMVSRIRNTFEITPTATALPFPRIATQVTGHLLYRIGTKFQNMKHPTFDTHPMILICNAKSRQIKHAAVIRTTI